VVLPKKKKTLHYFPDGKKENQPSISIIKREESKNPPPVYFYKCGRGKKKRDSSKKNKSPTYLSPNGGEEGRKLPR